MLSAYTKSNLNCKLKKKNIQEEIYEEEPFEGLKMYVYERKMLQPVLRNLLEDELVLCVMQFCNMLF